MKDAPLYEYLCEFANKNKISFHMPGHKNGRAFPQNPDIFRLDLTELYGLDNLQMPGGKIKEAEMRAADAFGADRTHFLVNGSTCGILAMIYATIGPGERVIVDRGCHESVIGALKLRGASAVFVSPEINDEFALPAGVRYQTVKEAFSRFRNIKAVIITSPNYFGMVSDIAEIAMIAHQNEAVLLVDEAHGAAFSFSDKLPATALSAGADAAVQSMHKTLPSPNQTALLHVKGKRVDDNKIKRAINMFQTTSPSYILLAYIDLCRAIMEDSEKEIDDMIDFVNEKRLSSGLSMLKTDDPLRLVINTYKRGISGYEAQKALIDNFGIYVEAADLYNIVCIINQYNTKDEVLKLFSAVCTLGGTEQTKEVVLPPMEDIKKISLDKEYDGIKVPLEAAAGLVSAENITPYPPGVPTVISGETISKEKIDYIQRIIESGGEVKNVKDRMVLAVKEN